MGNDRTLYLDMNFHLCRRTERIHVEEVNCITDHIFNNHVTGISVDEGGYRCLGE